MLAGQAANLSRFVRIATQQRPPQGAQLSTEPGLPKPQAIATLPAFRADGLQRFAPPHARPNVHSVVSSFKNIRHTTYQGLPRYQLGRT